MNNLIQRLTKKFSLSSSQPKRRRNSGSIHSFSKLEDRNLLASVTFGNVGFGDQLQFTADAGMVDNVSVETTSTGSIQFRVVGDTISIPTAANNNPALQLSSFATSNDTLTVDTTGNFGTGFGRLDGISVDLGDQNDTLSISVADNLLFNDTLALFFNGGFGNDQIDASGSTRAVRILGGAGNDQIIGGSGNDTILGDNTDQDAGQDSLFGGAGNDFISGSSGPDTINGGAGNDTILGGEGFDTIDGGAGFDINSFRDLGTSATAEVTGNGSGTVQHGTIQETFANIEGLTASNNGDTLTISGGVGGTLTGGSGDDILTGGSGDDQLIGNDGDDILRGGPGDDIAFGGLGNDSLNGGENNDQLFGGAGDDFFVGITGNDSIFGGAGFDTNSFQGIGQGVTAVIQDDGTGTVSYGIVTETFTDIEQLVGSEFDDDLSVDGSRPTSIFGLGGNDLLTGGTGADTLVGGAGNDTVRGGIGNDMLFGSAGDDFLNGGAGDDSLFGEAGDDFFVGIGGTDTISGGAGIDTNSFEGIGTGVTATVQADNSGTASYGQIQETFTGIENLTGSDFDDVLSVFTNRNTVLRGQGGNDILTSLAGNDSLFGGFGNDILRSGAGNDTSLGNEGDDRLNGGSGNDILFGGDGDDFFVGITGTDQIDGGLGTDLNSFEGIDLDVTVQVSSNGSGTAMYGPILESFTSIEQFFNATVTQQ